MGSEQSAEPQTPKQNGCVQPATHAVEVGDWVTPRDAWQSRDVWAWERKWAEVGASVDTTLMGDSLLRRARPSGPPAATAPRKEASGPPPASRGKGGRPRTDVLPGITEKDIFYPAPTATPHPQPTLLRPVRRTDSDDRHGDLLDIIDLPAQSREVQSRSETLEEQLLSARRAEKDSDDTGETFLGTLLQCGGRAKEGVMHCGGRAKLSAFPAPFAREAKPKAPRPVQLITPGPTGSGVWPPSSYRDGSEPLSSNL